ncbi:uncharacterized protein LOC122543552 isoform X5 [Chiloscyllium plagiosum]|uniref:uncharacterized protein LOC122543552 isoform X5 n=1 Tax=Chiloscyllium plagiosum TaxID=36176 RepID=UPI001CB8846F|nr:uncharacterized protein LOC122543552 isoform X5 [Chiloscyllium plagiosum]
MSRGGEGGWEEKSLERGSGGRAAVRKMAPCGPGQTPVTGHRRLPGAAAVSRPHRPAVQQAGAVKAILSRCGNAIVMCLPTENRPGPMFP